MVFSKKEFAIILSKLKVFENPNPKLEQYPTDSEVASDLLWNAALNGDVEGKIIADLGAGTGILGIGALLLGAKKVYFLELDPDAIRLAEENYKKIEEEYEIGEAEFIKGDIKEFDKTSDTIIQNPPFGVQDEHADKVFLEKAFQKSKIVYSLHKTETIDFLKAISKDRGFVISHRYNYDFLLKKTMKFHTRKNERIQVSAIRFSKK